MFLDKFHSVNQGRVVVSATQASQFAKDIAGDYNPIHNPDARRFCVPGDLLFALILDRFGLYQNMTFKFRSLLGPDVPLELNNSDGLIQVSDAAGKVYLEASCDGDMTEDRKLIEEVTRCYVAASGTNFPHTLKPLMESNGVMFNPQRPMIIYESMNLALSDLNIETPGLETGHSSLAVNGKRATASLEYQLMSAGKSVGKVEKTLVITGVRDYDGSAMDEIITQFYELQAEYKAARIA